MIATVLVLTVAVPLLGGAQTGAFEGRTISAIDIVFEDSASDPVTQTELLHLLHISTGGEYSAVRVRESLQELFNSELVSAVRVEVETAVAGNATGPIRIRFVVKRQLRVSGVRIDFAGPVPSDVLSASDIKSRLNLLESGSRASEHLLRTNADLIQTYLRDRGFFRAEVDYNQIPDPADTSGSRIIVVFRVTPNDQARVSTFTLDVKGFDTTEVKTSLRLQPGTSFTRDSLSDDEKRIRDALIAEGYLAPQLDEARTTLDSTANTVAISVTGTVGPKVTVSIQNYKLGEKAEREMIPVEHEGNIDPSAIVEGERRIRNRLQEDGYFFAEVTEICAVTPPLDQNPDVSAGSCENINPADLEGHAVSITYNVNRGRRFKLTDIRINGTDKLTYDDVADQLSTKEANALAFVPLLGGYGRGYTSRDILEQDRRTVKARMQDLGYVNAQVTVREGVSLNGDNLIVTFDVQEGTLTRVAGIEIRGNKIFTTAQVANAITAAGKDRCAARPSGTPAFCFPTVIGAPYSHAQARADADAVRALYARNGYVGAQVDFATVDLPNSGKDQRVKLVYTVRDEKDKIVINDIIINGVVLTKPEAIKRAITLRPGEFLQADKITESERILYATDAFLQVSIRQEPAGETASGYKQSNIIIDVEELKPHVLNYGAGYSTDGGPLGTIDIRNVNMFGALRQGAFRIRASGLQQLARIEYTDPRFKPYGKSQFSPLTLSIQYQRDSTVTRFFRTSIDRGNNGIVQRLDQNGKPIDEFGNRVSEPTINRFTFNAETQRTLNPKTHSVLFLRYSYEDVRLFNLDSLLVADILKPDRAIHLSRLGASFARDTRDSQFDTTRGSYLTADYSLALRQLGGNISFNKLQFSYSRYYRVEKLHRTVFAGNVTLGLANLFNPRDRDGIPGITEADLRLPISERFFAGGSTTLRGFGFDEAGPQQAIPGCQGLDFKTCFQQFGSFRDQNGNLVKLDPFTVPIGGNAMAIVNMEARVPLAKLFTLTPFYDGGNVFRSVRELFGRADPLADPNQRAFWTNTVGVGFGVKTPFGGTISIDYGYLLNPPAFMLPQADGATAIFRLQHGQIHFRLTTAF